MRLNSFVLIGLQIALSSGCMRYVPDLDVDDHLPLPWELDPHRKWTRTMKRCSCGTLRSPRVKGVAERPWNALIRFPVQGSKFKSCGGTLINSRFVLTAYSCFLKDETTPLDIWGPNSDKITPEHIKVFFNVKDNPLNVNDVGYEVEKIITNPNYVINKITRGPDTDNVAVLKLKKEINFEDATGPVPICILPTPKIPEDRSSTTVFVDLTGWADANPLDNSCTDPNIQSKFLADPFDLRREEDTPNSSLQCYAGATTILPNQKDCRTKSKMRNVTENQMCMNLHVGGGALVNSGWPLSISTKTNEIIQLGITSWDDDQALKHNPAGAHRFFTAVSDTLPFINYFSNEEGASWCQEPKEVNVVSKERRLSSGSDQTLAWDHFLSDKRIMKNDSCVCGERPENKARIVGGADANPHEFKWSAMLKYSGYFTSGGGKTHHLCGGSLINNKMILTAAHCVVQTPRAHEHYPGADPADYDIYLGAHYKTKNNQEGKLFKAKSIFYHPLYVAGIQHKPNMFDYDVALIQLEEPVTFDPATIMPICLPKVEEIGHLEVVGKPGWVTGWGNTQPTGNSATVLQKIELQIQPLEYCNKIVPVDEGKATDRVLCAGTLNRYKDAAGGDSGGPMSIVVGEKSNQFLQIGLVSYGHDVGELTAGFYTDVRKMLSFIDFFSANAGAEWCPMTRN